MKNPVRLLALAALFVLAFGAAYVRLPYYAEGPGPAREVQPLIDVGDEPRYDSTGKLIMTTVSFAPVTALQALRAWLDPAVRVVGEDVIYPDDVDPEVEQQRSRSEMDQSKIAATMVVLGELAGYPKEHGDGALIQGTAPECPAFNRLFSGDLILAVDGTQISTSSSRPIERSTRCRSDEADHVRGSRGGRDPRRGDHPGTVRRTSSRSRCWASRWCRRSRSRWRSRAAAWADHRPA